MASRDRGPRSDRNGSTRRQFLLGGTVAGVGAVSAIGIDAALRGTPPTATASEPLNGDVTVPFTAPIKPESTPRHRPTVCFWRLTSSPTRTETGSAG